MNEDKKKLVENMKETLKDGTATLSKAASALCSQVIQSYNEVNEREKEINAAAKKRQVILNARYTYDNILYVVSEVVHQNKANLGVIPFASPNQYSGDIQMMPDNEIPLYPIKIQAQRGMDITPKIIRQTKLLLQRALDCYCQERHYGQLVIYSIIEENGFFIIYLFTQRGQWRS